MLKIAGLILIMVVGAAKPSTAQVKSTTFDLTLENLLSHSVKELSVDEADSMKNSAIFLDSREKEEYNVSHIKNARWVGYEDFTISRLNGISKDKPVIVYCSIGYRSEKIAEKLKTFGFKNIYNLYGGIFEWKNQDKPVYNSRGKTDKVHAYDHVWGIWLNKGEKVYQ